LLLPFVLNRQFYLPLISISSLLIVVSFSISIYYLLTHPDSSDPKAE
jgi:hypothetical protein